MNAQELIRALQTAGIATGHATRLVATAERARRRDERLTDALRRTVHAEAAALAGLAADLVEFAAHLDALDTATWRAAA